MFFPRDPHPVFDHPLPFPRARDLKADEHFLSLQGNLKETGDKLADARNEYNEEVLTYNTKVQSFPTNLIALIFRFKDRDFFEGKEAEQREAPKAAM